MKKDQPGTHSDSTHQTVTDAIKLKMGQKSILIGFTGPAGQSLGRNALDSWIFVSQKVSGTAGTHFALSADESECAQTGGDRVEFSRGSHRGSGQAHAHRPFASRSVLPEVLQVRRIPSQSTLSRFFTRFTQARNQECFGQFFRWTLEQLSGRKEGYTLDLDTTGLIHEDGHQQGVLGLWTNSHSPYQV